MIINGDPTLLTFKTHIDRAIETGIRANSCEEANLVLSWFMNNYGVGEVRTDPFLLQPRIYRPEKLGPNGVTVTCVTDDCAEARAYPFLREYPHWGQEMRRVALPVESFTWTAMLSGLVLHEGTHVRDFDSNQHTARAVEIFPDMPVDKAIHIASEINAFSLEGELFKSLFGKKYSDWTQARIEACAAKAIEDFQKGINESNDDEEAVSIAFCTVDEARAIITEQIGFVNGKAKDFCESIVCNAILTAGCLETTDIFGRAIGANASQVAALKHNVLGDEYQY